jgi:hypothetical protein
MLYTYSDQYTIPGTRNRNRNPSYTDPRIEPYFQERLNTFKAEIMETLNNKSPRAYFKFGDGDFYFLNGIGKGSAAPGNRAISRKLTADQLLPFKENSKGADCYMCELAPENREMFKDTFGPKKIDYPAEIVYGLVANRWLFKIPNIRIGLIGAEEKLNLIKHLLDFSEYREYLGLEKFYNYVPIPQKFACDNLTKRLEELKSGLEREHCDLYLLGIGHLKSGVISQLGKYSNSIFLDIGSGIDALAGVIDRERPYFGDWINFRSRNFDYSSLDLLQYKKSRTKDLN